MAQVRVPAPAAEPAAAAGRARGDLAAAANATAAATATRAALFFLRRCFGEDGMAPCSAIRLIGEFRTDFLSAN